MTNKDKYRRLCKTTSNIPIFSMDWWLDITAGEHNWDVSIVESNNEIIASLPYYKSKKYVFDIISMPVMTPSLGVWIKYPNEQKYTTKLSYEKETFTALIDNLPRHDYFFQQFHWSITNGMPFYWRGFNLSMEYTYMIENTMDLAYIFANFRENIRREIRKAEKVLTVVTEEDSEKFYQIHKKTFDRQNINKCYSLELIQQIDEACRIRNCRKMLFAVDDAGQVHSAIYIIWDSKCVYYLMGGGDPVLRTSGATSLLLWKAIQDASHQSKQFDFVGSIIEPIDRFFRGFGAVQKPYLQLTKSNGKLIKWAYLAKQGLKLLVQR